jgi:hypothetical protein
MLGMETVSFDSCCIGAVTRLVRCAASVNQEAASDPSFDCVLFFPQLVLTLAHHTISLPHHTIFLPSYVLIQALKAIALDKIVAILKLRMLPGLSKQADAGKLSVHQKRQVVNSRSSLLNSWQFKIKSRQKSNAPSSRYENAEDWRVLSTFHDFLIIGIPSENRLSVPSWQEHPQIGGCAVVTSNSEETFLPLMAGCESAPSSAEAMIARSSTLQTTPASTPKVVERRQRPRYTQMQRFENSG